MKTLMGAAFKTTEKAQAEMKQFDLMWAELPNPIGQRPVLLLTRTPGYAYLNKILIAEVTSTVRSIPQEVLLGKKKDSRVPQL